MSTHTNDLPPTEEVIVGCEILLHRDTDLKLATYAMERINKILATPEDPENPEDPETHTAELVEALGISKHLEDLGISTTDLESFKVYQDDCRRGNPVAHKLLYCHKYIAYFEVHQTPFTTKNLTVWFKTPRSPEDTEYYRDPTHRYHRNVSVIHTKTTGLIGLIGEIVNLIDPTEDTPPAENTRNHWIYKILANLVTDLVDEPVFWRLVMKDNKDLKIEEVATRLEIHKARAVDPRDCCDDAVWELEPGQLYAAWIRDKNRATNAVWFQVPWKKPAKSPQEDPTKNTEI